MPALLGIESAYSRRLRSSLEVARIFQRYNLVPVPVAGEAGLLAGLIAIDGIAAVIQEEAGAEVKALCGVSEQKNYRTRRCCPAPS